MDVADGAQSFGSLLGGQIALSFGQHLITNHKLADRRGAAAADKSGHEAASGYGLRR